MSAAEKVLSSLSNRILCLEETIEVPEELNIGEDIVEYVQYDRKQYPAENSVGTEEEGLSFCFISQFNRNSAKRE